MVGERIADCAIDLRQAQELVARRQRQRGDDRVEPRSRILDKRPILAPSPEKPGHPPGRLAQQAREVAAKEGAGVGLHGEPPPLRRVEHALRRRAIAAMVEVVDPLGEPEVRAPDVAEPREVAQWSGAIPRNPWVRTLSRTAYRVGWVRVVRLRHPHPSRYARHPLPRCRRGKGAPRSPIMRERRGAEKPLRGGFIAHKACGQPRPLWSAPDARPS